MKKLLLCLLAASVTPAGAGGLTAQPGGSFVIKNVTLLTAGPRGRIAGGAVLVENGKIRALGEVTPPAGTPELDGGGGYLTPGIIDCHSHIAVEGGVNEGALSVTSMVRIADVIDPEDIDIYRDLAGGVTAANILHGSANSIGGQNQVIKMRWGGDEDALRFEGAPPGIKFALGENPKRRGSSPTSPRYPATRMGVEDTIRDAFHRARAYRTRLQQHQERLAAGHPSLPPRRDLELEALVEVLEGRRLAHCHCYRADEIVMILRLAEEFGFRIATLQHVLEGYKVAPEIARHGAGASTFSDWWAYKIEAYDAIPHNAAVMARAGVTVSINSDSAEEARHLNQEAAKSMRYGGLTEEEALKLVTINPARQLGIAHRVGSIETGKDADLVLWDRHPFDTAALPQKVWIDGRVYFSREEDARRRAEIAGKQRKIAPPPARAATAGAGPRKNLRAKPLQTAPRLPAEDEIVAIRGARIHPVAGPEIPDGVVIIRGGKIQAAGAGLDIPREARIVEARGLHIYPGLIDAFTPLGLVEIGSIRETSDTAEIGDMHPQLEAYDAVHPASEHIPVTRVAGVTTVLSSPMSGVFAGRAALLDLEGATVEEMVLARYAGLTVNIPASPRKKSGGQEDAALRSRRAASEMLEQARHYAGAVAAAAEGRAKMPQRDEQLEALRPVIQGTLPVIARASSQAAIRQAVEWAAAEGIRVVIAGASEAGKLAGYLAERGVPVIYGPVQSLPDHEDDPYDYPYATPAILHRAGVKVAISVGDESFARTLAFEAGTAVAGGLAPAEALRAITLAPAEILGIDHLVGSIREGRLANLVIADGDILQITTQIRHVFIRGREVSPETRHTRLWEKYRRRR